jgi:hypothetical protein
MGVASPSQKYKIDDLAVGESRARSSDGVATKENMA